MASSDPNQIQPIRSGSSNALTPNVFSGTVTGITLEKGVQTLEVQYAQGKVRFAAEGDFQAGEKVRISFPGGNAIQVAQLPTVPAQEEWQGAGYILPQKLNSLRGFEEAMVKWMANTETQSMGRTGGAGSPALSASLAQLTLPELLMKVTGKNGGKEFLGQSLTGMDRNLIAILIDALEASKGDPGAKSAVLDMLKSQNRGNESVAPAGAAKGLKNLDGFWSAEAGTGASPWFGRVIEKGEGESFLSPLNRLQYGGRGAPTQGDSLFRYVLDVGGRSMEVFSSQSLEPGDLADFTVEAHGGRMQAKFLDPAASLPASLRTDFATASPTMRQAVQLASHYLKEFKDEPYSGQLVKDFADLLAQSGRMEKAASPLNTGRSPGLPDQKELDGLLRLFLTFPRDGLASGKQAKAWSEAARDPQAMTDMLKNLRPNQDSALLRPGTNLQFPKTSADASLALGMPLPGATGETNPSNADLMAAWLKKVLPERFHSLDIHRLAEENPALSSAVSKDPDSAKFLLQAVVNGLPRDNDIQQGKPSQFYFYQGQDWHGLQVTWEKGSSQGSDRKSGPKEPLKVRVETHAKHMGKVNVAVTLDDKGAKIDFKNQFYDVRELLTKALPELEKSLDYLDFKIMAWTYAILPEEHLPTTSEGAARPANFSDGINLDLFG